MADGRCKTSYLVGEQADCLLNGTPADWLGPASEDFAGFVAERRGMRTRWGVPSTIFWYDSGEYYLDTLVVRHRLTPNWTKPGDVTGLVLQVQNARRTAGSRLDQQAGAAAPA